MIEAIVDIGIFLGKSIGVLALSIIAINITVYCVYKVLGLFFSEEKIGEILFTVLFIGIFVFLIYISFFSDTPTDNEPYYRGIVTPRGIR